MRRQNAARTDKPHIIEHIIITGMATRVPRETCRYRAANPLTSSACMLTVSALQQAYARTGLRTYVLLVHTQKPPTIFR